MKIKFELDFLENLASQVHFISKDKPKAARKFKVDLLKKLRKDLKFPYHFKKSIYYNNENIRDYVFKGYVCVYKIEPDEKVVTVFGFIKYKESL